MKKQCLSWLHAIAWVYIIVVGGWFIAYLAFGDRFGLLAFVNLLAVTLFSPLPFLIIIASLIRQKGLWAGTVGLCLVFIWLWGGLFIPKQRAVSAHTANDGSLSVMTYNLLGWHTLAGNQIEVIRAENADVVMLQELNFSTSQVVQSVLIDVYPYQILAPGSDVTGMGVISKYPINSTGATLQADHWIGDPQVLSLEWRGKQVSLVNVHMRPSNSIIPRNIRETSNSRELQARAITDFVQNNGAVIVGGDTNTTSLSDSYKILTSGLVDSWKEAGFGFGHTFPGSNISGSSRPVVFGILSPQWMTRIDLILHSSHWQGVSVHTAPFDQVSDHRGVTAILDWIE